jgi:hypothetical protein
MRKHKSFIVGDVIAMAMVRNVLFWMLIAVLPLPVLAANPNAAMLYTKGTAWLNGGTVPSSSALFPGDMVQTKVNSLANINAAGSSVMILSDSLVKFEGSAVSINRGGVSIKTAKGLQTRTEDVTVAPSSGVAEFNVSNTDGELKVMALKGDVSISDGSSTTTLSEGQQTTRDLSSRKERKRHGGAAPAAGGGIMDSPIVVAAGGAAIGALVTWVALQSSNPASPSVP